MGVGYIFKWLKSRIASAIIRKHIPIDTLFIDAKQLYYPCIKKGVDEIDAIKPFIQKLQNTIKRFKTKELIFISMDGPNPAAKFQTQRLRKYRKEHKIGFVPPNEPFEMLSIKQAADLLDKALKDSLSKIINLPKIQTKHIFYSSGFAPGEAEHKFFQYFREAKNSPDWKPNQNHFIFSGDNDLIFLALQFVDENFYIIKPFNEGTISISVIRDYFLKLIHDSLGDTKKEIDDKKVIQDIISLSFILGNDFIPDFPDIKPSPDVFDLFINAYISINKNGNPQYRYLIENDVFNVSTLRELISIFFNKQVIIPDNLNDPSLSEVKIIAQDTLRILNFNCLYYSNGPPSWTYYYPHQKSLNIFNAVSLMVQEEKDFFDNIQYDEVTDPFLKALVNHPPDSMVNIPWNIYKIKIPPSPIAEKYWPSSYKTLPMFNLEEIKIYYKKELASLPPKELEFNRRDPLYIPYNKTMNIMDQNIRPNRNQARNHNDNDNNNNNNNDNDDDNNNNNNNRNNKNNLIRLNQIQTHNQELNPALNLNQNSTIGVYSEAPYKRYIGNNLSARFGKIKSVKTINVTMIEFEQEESASLASGAGEIDINGQKYIMAPLPQIVSNCFLLPES
ncbi:5'-3' exoribonuclease 1 [Tritrichomonas musculus]|uniref:5'-3' exoribonuclease 1 n=1 Tax=Tritrichomonas musculus TaxID=1915356 RepID=A0ABR2K4C4_9EUKA